MIMERAGKPCGKNRIDELQTVSGRQLLFFFFLQGRDKQELGWHQTTEGLMVLLRDVVVLVIMVLQIAHLC